MTESAFLTRLATGKPVVLDGATGTNLQLRGLPAGAPSDIWALDNPGEVLRLHRSFLEAGSELILTDTFGSSKLHLAHAGLAERFEQTNRQAVALALEAASPYHALVGGSMGPLGEMVEPYGTLTLDAAQAEYAAQARLLSEAGVDVLVIETQFDLGEAEAALKGALSVTNLPIVVSFSYDRGTRTMMGVKPAKMAAVFAPYAPAALGINCGKSLEENLAVLRELRAAANLPLWFKPNAGLPGTDSAGRTVFSVTPGEMGAAATDWLAEGAQLVGGCCGTSPEHLAAIARTVKQA